MHHCKQVHGIRSEASTATAHRRGPDCKPRTPEIPIDAQASRRGPSVPSPRACSAVQSCLTFFALDYASSHVKCHVVQEALHQSAIIFRVSAACLLFAFLTIRTVLGCSSSHNKCARRCKFKTERSSVHACMPSKLLSKTVQQNSHVSADQVYAG